MFTDDNFDVEHLKKVMAELTAANAILDGKKSVSTAGGQIALRPQMKREKFVKEVVGTSLFKSLQQEFFKIIPKLGQDILMACNEAYNNQQLTNEQRDELAKIGNMLASELPFKMLSGTLDIKTGFIEFVGALKNVTQFFKNNPSVALSLGQNLLENFKPLQSFINITKTTVEKSDVSEFIQQGFKERLNLIESQSGQIRNVIQSAIEHPVKSPSMDVSNLLIASPFMQTLQKNLLPMIFPIGGTILNVGLELFNGGFLNDKQRNALGDIGKDIMSVPADLLTGKIDFSQALTSLGNSLKSLGSFFISNPDIAIKAGAKILPALLPLGGFLKEAFSLVSKSEFAQQAIGGILKQGLSFLSKALGGVENTLEQSALRVIHSKKRT
jgi:hypothetical protein